jgi:hypothetical protein
MLRGLEEVTYEDNNTSTDNSTTTDLPAQQRQQLAQQWATLIRQWRQQTRPKEERHND